MPSLDDFIAEPRLCQLDSIELGAPAREAFQIARRFDLARVPLADALFWLRTLPERMSHRDSAMARPSLRIADIGHTGSGFQVLAELPERLIVGAIGRFWETKMTFAEVPVQSFAGFDEPGWGKVAWELRCEPDQSAAGCRVAIELRVSATDDESWHKLARYFRLIGPFSHFFRRQALSLLAREIGTPEEVESKQALAGDTIIAAPKAQVTDAITIDAPPSAVWPWLVQMGCRRAGWYSHDELDNGGALSETVIVPELQHIAVGDVLPATPEGAGGFTVLEIDEPRALVLGALVDTEHERGLAIDAPKPAHYFQSSWAFVLEPLAGGHTRLLVRARVDFEPSTLQARIRTRVLGLVHHFMEREQLANLKRRAEGKMPRVNDSWLDIGEGALGALEILTTLVTPFLHGMRAHWGMTRAEAERTHAGDEYVPEPSWQWTHAVDVEAPPEAVWPWVAQLGQDKAGFYSYQFLENLVGSDIQNASRVHTEWQSPRVGDSLRLHHRIPPLQLAAVESGRLLIARAGVDESAAKGPSKDKPATANYVAVSWALLLEPRPGGKTRLVSRFRSGHSTDLATRVLNGSYLTGSLGFVMDRRMLRSIRHCVEHARVPQKTTIQP